MFTLLPDAPALLAMKDFGTVSQNKPFLPKLLVLE